MNTELDRLIEAEVARQMSANGTRAMRNRAIIDLEKRVRILEVRQQVILTILERTLADLSTIPQADNMTQYAHLYHRLIMDTKKGLRLGATPDTSGTVELER